MLWCISHEVRIFFFHRPLWPWIFVGEVLGSSPINLWPGQSCLCYFLLHVRDACTKFRDLWRRKHETGQWLEIEAAETMSNRSDFSPLNVSGIILPSMASASHTELDSESNGKASSGTQHFQHIVKLWIYGLFMT